MIENKRFSLYAILIGITVCMCLLILGCGQKSEIPKPQLKPTPTKVAGQSAPVPTKAPESKPAQESLTTSEPAASSSQEAKPEAEPPREIKQLDATNEARITALRAQFNAESIDPKVVTELLDLLEQKHDYDSAIHYCTLWIRTDAKSEEPLKRIVKYFDAKGQHEYTIHYADLLLQLNGTSEVAKEYMEKAKKALSR